MEWSLATEEERSEWLVKGKEGNESMGVGESESAPNSLDCQFTSKPSLSSLPTPPPMSQTHLKCCCFGCRVPAKTHGQTEWVCETRSMRVRSAQTPTQLSPPDTAGPHLNSAALDLDSKNKIEKKNLFLKEGSF